MDTPDVGQTIVFLNPEDTGLTMGGTVLAHLPAEGEFEGGYLMVSHYVISNEHLAEFRPETPPYSIVPSVTRMREQGLSEQAIAYRYGLSLEELLMRVPKAPKE